jgi:hypothetical protein
MKLIIERSFWRFLLKTYLKLNNRMVWRGGRPVVKEKFLDGKILNDVQKRGRGRKRGGGEGFLRNVTGQQRGLVDV